MGYSIQEAFVWFPEFALAAKGLCQSAFCAGLYCSIIKCNSLGKISKNFAGKPWQL